MWCDTNKPFEKGHTNETDKTSGNRIFSIDL